MELEAWLLAFKDLFVKLDKRLNNQYIEKKLGYHLEKIDPEKAFFHPTKQIEAILQLIQKSYNKSKEEVNSLLSHI